MSRVPPGLSEDQWKKIQADAQAIRKLKEQPGWEVFRDIVMRQIQERWNAICDRRRTKEDTLIGLTAELRALREIKRLWDYPEQVEASWFAEQDRADQQRREEMEEEFAEREQLYMGSSVTI